MSCSSFSHVRLAICSEIWEGKLTFTLGRSANLVLLAASARVSPGLGAFSQKACAKQLRLHKSKLETQRQPVEARANARHLMSTGLLELGMVSHQSLLGVPKWVHSTRVKQHGQIHCQNWLSHTT
jgi:hypothetical protein